MSDVETLGYRVILPRHWVHLPVQGDTRERLRVFVDDAVQRLPSKLSPDEIGPLRRSLETRLLRQLDAARAAGGRDVYLPGPHANGLLLGASVIVSEAGVPTAPDSAADGAVLALLATDGGRPVELDGTGWVRHEKTVETPDDDGTGTIATRQVTYTGQRPGNPPRWMIAAFSCVGDGDPASAHTDVVVDLFDAIMGTWVWIRETDAAAVKG